VYYLEKSEFKRELRQFRGKVSEYIGADVDTAVLGNRRRTECLDNERRASIGDGEVDVVICDWVLEHIVDVGSFKNEVHRVLKQGAFCARVRRIR